jgi:hypothetical protein
VREFLKSRVRNRKEFILNHSTPPPFSLREYAAWLIFPASLFRCAGGESTVPQSVRESNHAIGSAKMESPELHVVGRQSVLLCWVSISLFPQVRLFDPQPEGRGCNETKNRSPVFERKAGVCGWLPRLLGNRETILDSYHTPRNAVKRQHSDKPYASAR